MVGVQQEQHSKAVWAVQCCAGAASERGGDAEYGRANVRRESPLNRATGVGYVETYSLEEAGAGTWRVMKQALVVDDHPIVRDGI